MKNFIKEMMNLSFKFFNIMLSRDPDLVSNQAISPYSFSQALGIIANGADEPMQSIFLKNLGFTNKITEYNENSYVLYDKLISDNKKYLNDYSYKNKHLTDPRYKIEGNLRVQNFLLYDNKFTMEEKFETQLNKFYDVKFIPFDSKNIDQAISRLNEFVCLSTDNNIKKACETISPNTCLLLMNVLHLDINFSRKFYTCKDVFNSFTGTIEHDMIYNWDEYETYEDEKKIVINNHYTYGGLSFLAVMPKDISYWKEVSSSISNNDELNDLMSKMEWKHLKLTFPKFEYEDELNFSDYTRDLELEGILNSLNLIPGVDFDNIKVKQKLYIKVNEFGTTNNNFVDHCTRRGGELHEELKIDKPFLWYIVTNHKNESTKKIIFMGKYLHPEN
ncbi:serpin-type proteinase inhibitor 12 [Vairimorpha necatrix]|uniref:Serpin-type proteinase inhibitor 12 n=1 Tax=Vairimorpha necatrix TaxID=6039 RepID=A0AAX4JGN8_9MICR